MANIVSSSPTRYKVVGLKCMQMLNEFMIADCVSVKRSSVSACNGTQISVCVIRLGPLGDDGFKSLNMQLSLQIEQVYSGPFYQLISYYLFKYFTSNERLALMAKCVFLFKVKLE